MHRLKDPYHANYEGREGVYQSTSPGISIGAHAALTLACAMIASGNEPTNAKVYEAAAQGAILLVAALDAKADEFASEGAAVIKLAEELGAVKTVLAEANAERESLREQVRELQAPANDQLNAANQKIADLNKANAELNAALGEVKRDSEKQNEQIAELIASNQKLTALAEAQPPAPSESSERKKDASESESKTETPPVSNVSTEVKQDQTSTAVQTPAG